MFRVLGLYVDNPTFTEARLKYELALVALKRRQPEVIADLANRPAEIDPVTYFFRSNIFEVPTLSDMFERLSATSASEASVERFFSKQGLVHTELRNRLLADAIEASIRVAALYKVGKLEHVPPPTVHVEQSTMTEFLQFLSFCDCRKRFYSDPPEVGDVVEILYDEGPCTFVIKGPHPHPKCFTIVAVDFLDGQAGKRTRRRLPAHVATEEDIYVFNPIGENEDTDNSLRPNTAA